MFHFYHLSPVSLFFFFSSFFNDERHAVPNYNQHISMRNQDSTPIVWTVYYFFFRGDEKFDANLFDRRLQNSSQGMRQLSPVCKIAFKESSKNCMKWSKWNNIFVKKIRCTQKTHAELETP